MNKYKFDEIKIGMQEEFKVEITPENMKRFGYMTGDVNPLHNDENYAFKYGYNKCVGYGMLTASYLSTLAGVYLPGEKSLIQSVEINFIKPVLIGDILIVKGEVINKNNLFHVITIKTTIINSKKEKVVRGKMQVGVLE